MTSRAEVSHERGRFVLGPVRRIYACSPDTNVDPGQIVYRVATLDLLDPLPGYI
jgi:hypothetical protein